MLKLTPRHHSDPRRFIGFKSSVFVFLLSLLLTQGVLGQASPKSTTPSAFQVAGSYPLSGFENISYFNGTVTAALPLATIGGRGEAGFSAMLTVGDEGWRVDMNFELIQCLPSSSPNCYYNVMYYPYWGRDGNGTFKAGLGPGKIRFMSTGRFAQSGCGGNGNEALIERLTTLTVAMPGGSTVELRDRLYDGKPMPGNACGATNGPSRGTIFDSKDGSGMTFISDTTIEDQWTPGPQGTLGGAPNGSGTLFLKNGLRYRFDNGRVSRITDRNGNWVSFTYGGLYSLDDYVATDSVGRQLQVQTAADQIVTITTARQNNTTRVIKYYPTGLALNGCQQLTYSQAFPELNGSMRDWANSLVPGCGGGRLELPDGRNYKFFYGQYNYLARIELPTGGAYEYDWGNGNPWGGSGAFAGSPSYNAVQNDRQHYYGWVYRRIRERRVYDNGGTGANYTSKQTINGGVVREYVAGNPSPISRTDHFYFGDPMNSLHTPNPYYNEGWQAGREYQTDIYAGDGTQLLRRVQQTYQQRAAVSWYCQYNQQCSASHVDQPMNDPRLVETVTTLADTNQVSKTSAINPNTGVVGFDQYNNQTDVYEFDYGSGAPGGLVRHTHTDFVTDTNYISETGPYLRSLPLQTWVSADANGTTKASLTQFEYDNYNQAPNQPDTNHAALEPRTGYTIVGHDTANYGADKYIRGNVTKVTTYGNAQAQTGAISVYSQYDILGNVVKTKDARGFETAIDYSDRFGSPDFEAQSNTAPTQLGTAKTFAFPTMTTNPLGWTTYTQYDYFTGLPVNAEDINGIVSKTVYDDPLDRPTQTVTAVGVTGYERQSNTTYDDANKRIETKTDLNAVNDNLLKSEVIYDGLGRTIEARKYESGGGYVATKSVPFAVVQDPQTSVWRVASKVSNPYRPGLGEPLLWTTSLVDELGRPSKVITPDGAIAKTEYNGNATTVTDQALKQRRSITNALGQLIRVDEPDKTTGQLGDVTAPVQPTSYEYNALGKMVHVQQDAQHRWFMYDSLGRLLRVKQPEQDVNTDLNTTGNPGNNSWTAGFSYDNNGNVLTAKDAKNTEIVNTYDALNRALTRTYSDGTPTVTSYYDGAGLPSVPLYSKGKLTRVASTVSESRNTEFDQIGRLKQFQQITDGQTYTSSYQYNLSGALIQETYPSGRVVQNDLESDGDLMRIHGKATPTSTDRTYATGFGYFADGKIEKLKLGNGLWEFAKQNSRLQVWELSLGYSAGNGGLMKLNTEYGELQTNGTVDATKNAGNIGKQTLSFNGLANPFVQTFSYDHLYRLTEAKETNNGNQTWRQVFDYDRYGNRITHNKWIGTTPVVQDNKTHPSIDPAKNRFQTTQGYTFDANGNITIDADGRQFTFNGDNKQTEVKDAQNSVIGQYFYDGEGKRIKKVTASETTIFVYSGSKLIAEYSTAAPPPQPTTRFTITDQLGSPRVIVNSLGQVESRRDFMPFGEEVAVDGTYRTTNQKYGTTGNVRQQFTGYQKDEETGLDFAEARMYENRHGRFTAVDPLLASGKSWNPQTFNRYVYVLNNPVILSDPTGLQVGDWYVPIRPDGTVDESRNYEYVRRGDPTDGYRLVTERNKLGELIGPGQGLADGFVIRFNPMGPGLNNNISTILEDIVFGPIGGSDYVQNGWDIVRTDEARADYMRTGAVENAIEPVDIALIGSLRSGLGSRQAAADLIDDAALATRVSEIHGALDPIAQNMRTTAIVETKEGVNLVASSRNTLAPSQRAMLTSNEVAVTGPGHAEVTALRAAAREGLTPTRVAASRTICGACQNQIFTMRAKPINPMTSIDQY